MRVRILGSGDAFGSGGRFNTCIHVTTGEHQILVDCGASSMVAMRRFAVAPEAIDAVLITHLHGDHFGGLPFFLLHAHYEAARERPLLLAGPPGLREQVEQAMAIFFNGVRPDWRFALEVVELTPGQRAAILGVEVEPFPVVHGPKHCYALRIDDGDKVFSFSGDTTWTETLVEAARGADLFLMECYAYDKRLPNHTDWLTLREHLPELDARRIILTHMSPAMLARRDEVPVETAEDGLEVEL